MAGVMHVDWYPTVLRKDLFEAEVSRVAPHALRYGATQYAVHRSRDDRYKITQMAWFDSKPAWYSYWEGPDSDHLHVVRRTRRRRARPRGRSRAGDGAGARAGTLRRRLTKRRKPTPAAGMKAYAWRV
jgi:hypothetical protein